MNMMILSVDVGTEFDDMPPELRAAVVEANVQWPESIMPGTKEVAGKVLVLILASPTGEEIQQRIDGFGLSWQVLATEAEPVNQSALLPFFLPEPVYSPETDSIDFVPVTDITNKLQTWAGRQWVY